MGTFASTFIIVFITFGLASLMINLRWVVKGEPFRGTCATNNPMLKSQLGDCNVCGKTSDEICKMPDTHDKNGAMPAV